MAEQAKFISGDGVEHEVDVNSPAFQIMSKDGSFTRVDDWHTERDNLPAEEPERSISDEGAEGDLESDEIAELATLSRPELVAKAKELGVKASGKNPELIAAIEAKIVELRESAATAGE